MFSKEESKLLRQLFWTSFGKSYPRKWILYNTKIKGLSFKFHFDRKSALVCLDLDGDLELRIKNWEKLMSLKAILTGEYLPEANFEETCILENGKEISRIFVACNQPVSIHDKSSWATTMRFFYDAMDKFEEFFRSYKDIISG